MTATDLDSLGFRGARPQRAAAVGLLAAERWLFLATVILAGTLVWMAPRLPMTDLAQHAGQVSLWRDLLRGASPWSSLVRINLLTPYLAGYGLTLPFSFVMPLHDAVRVVLTLAFYGFVAACLALRRSLGGDPRLDWLFLFGYFGFAWYWGFLTFLVSAPVAVLVLLLAHRYSARPSLSGGTVLVAAGTALLFCHGLAFLMTLGIAGLMAICSAWTRGLRGLAVALVPSLALAAACLLFRLASQGVEGAITADTWSYGAPFWQRPIASLIYVNAVSQGPDRLLLATAAFMVYVPRLLRSRFNRGIAPSLFAGLCLTIAVLPNYAFQTYLLYQRFALFLLPFYAFMFRPAAPSPMARDGWRTALVIGACWLMLGAQALRIRDFATESRPFETVLDAAQPGRRALALVYDAASPAAHNDFVYAHFPAWYQAESGGFVDFNFAAFAPQVVRFRTDADPRITDEMTHDPDKFALTREALRRYAYLFVRGTDDDLARLRSKSPCGLSQRARDGSWTLLEPVDCAAEPEPKD